MARTPNMRLLARVVLGEDSEPVIGFHPKPYDHSSRGGPPDECQVKGVTQVTVHYAHQIVIFRWVELELIPDPEMVDD